MWNEKQKIRKDMKKTKYIQTIFILLTSMIASVSCNNDGEEWLQNNEDSSLQIKACITDTRSIVTGTEFKKGDKIGVYTIYNKNGISIGGASEIPDNSLNIAAQYDGTEWLFDESIKLYNNSAYVYAYYPFQATTKAAAPSGLEIPVINVDISPDIKNEQTDYMYGVGNNVNANNTTADIQFKHALARITLSILKGTNDVGKGHVSKVCLKNNTKVQTISPKGWIRLNGETGTEGNIEDALILNNDVTINEKEAQNIDLLVFPATGKRGTELITNVTESVEVILTIDGQDYSFPLSGMTWLGGQQYTYPITIDRKTKPIIKFNGHEAIDMGILTEVGMPIYWSTMNIGANTPEDYGELYCWGDPTGKNFEDYEYNNEYDFFPDDISGTEYDIARVQWESKWRIPTETEWQQLIEHSTLSSTNINGTKGTIITSNINGNSIFLPAAGYYSHHSAMVGAGSWELDGFETIGAYWSSSRDWGHAFVQVFPKNEWKAPLGGQYSIRPVISD